MVPKLDISLPDLLRRIFYNPRTYGPEEKLESDIKNFKDFFETHGEAILGEIEVFSGFKWKGEKIPVYLVPNGPVSPPYSFTTRRIEGDLTGVLQKIGYQTPERAIHIFIHELAHVNQHRSDYYDLYGLDEEGNRNYDLAELCADIITIYVIRELFGPESEYEKDMWDFLDNSNEKNKRKGDILRKYMDNWNLGAHPLRYYLERDKTQLENLL